MSEINQLYQYVQNVNESITSNKLGLRDDLKLDDLLLVKLDRTGTIKKILTSITLEKIKLLLKSIIEDQSTLNNFAVQQLLFLSMSMLAMDQYRDAIWMYMMPKMMGTDLKGVESLYDKLDDTKK